MASRVTKEHLDLLRQFGRSRLQREMPVEQKRDLWEHTCRITRLEVIPYDEVVEQWRKVSTGDSQETGLAIGATLDPGFISVAVTYKKLSIGAHTTHANAVLRSVLAIVRKEYKDGKSFMQDVERLTRSVDATYMKQRKERDDRS